MKIGEIVWPRKVPKAGKVPDYRSYTPFEKFCCVCKKLKRRDLFPTRSIKRMNKKKPELVVVCLDCIRLAIGD